MFKCGVYVTNNITLCPPLSNLTQIIRPTLLRDTTYEVVVELYLISILCLIGLFGNIVSVVVLRKDKERKEALFLLQALAVADGLYLTVALFRYPLKHILPDPATYTVMQPYVFPTLKLCQAICIWMMVLVTIDRYIYVCQPLRAQLMFTYRSRRIMTACVCILCFLYSLPRFFQNCIVHFFDPCTNITLTKMIYTPTFHNQRYFDIYNSALYILLLYIAPLTILVVMNLKLVRAIKHSRRRHSQLSSSPPSDNNATLVLMIIVLVFIVCETPELILRVLLLIDRYHSAELFSNVTIRFSTTNELLMVINSSINFFIYLVFGRRFRKVLRETFDFKAMITTTGVTRESIPLQNHFRCQNHIYRVQ